MKSAFYDAVEDATRSEFHLISELGGADGWAAFLARGRADGRLAVLLLQEADGGEFDLEILHEIDGGIPAGHITCPACGTADEGWPRFCPACRADISGLAPDEAVPGAGAAELLQQVREAAAGEYEVLGALPHAEGGGALYFAREEQGGHVVGLALHLEDDDSLALIPSWAPSTAPQPAAEPAAWEPEPFTAAPEAVASLDTVPAGAGSPSWLEPPRERVPTRSERERRQRRVAGGAVAVIATALVAALVLAFTRQLAVPRTGITHLSDTVAPVLPAFQDTTAGAADPASTAGTQETVTDRGPAVETALPRREPETTAASTPEPPRTEPEAAPSGPPSPGLVEPAIARYTSAVGSRQLARIRDAYPGITAREVGRWERFLGQHASLRARYELQDAPRVTGTTAEVLFTLTLSYPGSSGEEMEMPLPLRAVLQWTGRDWSLREVLSLAGNGP